MSDIFRSVPDQPSESTPLAKVVGRNCQRLRKRIGVTQDELARCARSIGLDWTETRVGHFEAGRSVPTFATVFAVTAALQWALDDATNGEATWAVTLAELVENDGSVALTDALSFTADQLASVCRGQPWAFERAEGFWRSDQWRASLGLYEDMFGEQAISGPERLQMRSGLTEDRLTKSLGIHPDDLADVSFRLWQKTFSEERDERAGPRANQQKRGRVSRELRAET